jgi:predicted nucleic acid-binding protein
MSRVFLDTNIFIYLIEDEGEFGRKSVELIERLTTRRDLVYTSTLTLGEVLTQPLSKGDTRLADLYEEKLSSPGVHLLDFDRVSARNYARIRLDRSIKAPDAMQLSMAAAARCDLFVTNDERLSKKVVDGIQFIAGLDRVPV